MLISEFAYDLPEELIAQNPLEKRENSRMLTVNRDDKNFTDEHFYNFPQFLKRRRGGSQQHKGFSRPALRRDRNGRASGNFSGS
jgi:hypothetical protein